MQRIFECDRLARRGALNAPEDLSPRHVECSAIALDVEIGLDADTDWRIRPLFGDAVDLRILIREAVLDIHGCEDTYLDSPCQAGKYTSTKIG